MAYIHIFIFAFVTNSALAHASMTTSLTSGRTGSKYDLSYPE